MATSIINDSVDEDYASLAVWESAKNGDITSSGSEIAEIRSTDGILSGSVTFSGWTTDTSNQVIVTSPSDDRHAGYTNSGGPRLRQGGGGDLFTVAQPNLDLVIKWLNFTYTGRDNVLSSGSTSVSGTHRVIFRNNILSYDTSAYRWAGDASAVYLRGRHTFGVFNNIIEGWAQHVDGTDPWWAIDTAQTLTYFYCYNNTIYNCDKGIRTNSYQNNVDVRNNIVNDCIDGDEYAIFGGYEGGVVTTSNNIADTADSPDVDYRNLDVAFQDVGSNNYLLDDSDTSAKGAGTDLGTSSWGFWEIDILGRDRDAEGDTWDIGAHQTYSDILPNSVFFGHNF